MCYRPIHIHKASNGFVAFDVPCGNCDECREQKRTDMFVRAWQEYASCGGRICFTTLTFNNENLPYLLTCPEMPIYDGFMNEVDSWPADYTTCWNRDLYKKFIKAVKEKLQYYYGTNILHLQRLISENGHRKKNPEWKEKVDSFKPFKYLTVCERGNTDIYYDRHGRQRFGSHRPHYHLLLFINFHIPDSKVLEIISQSWTYGFVYNEMVDRTPIKVLDYIVKYITKPEQEACLKSPGFEPSFGKNARPFTASSQFLGIDLLDGSIEQVEWLHERGISIPSSTSEPRTVNLPNYYLKRFTHKTVQDRTLTAPYRQNVEFYLTGSSPTWVDVGRFDWLRCTKQITKSVLTDFGKKIQDKNQKNKTDYYSRFLVMCQGNKPLVESVQPGAFPFITDINEKSFRHYVQFEHYISYDQKHYPTKFTDALELLKRIDAYQRKQKRDKRKLDFASNLDRARAEAPNLWNRHPVPT